MYVTFLSTRTVSVNGDKKTREMSRALHRPTSPLLSDIHVHFKRINFFAIAFELDCNR